MATWTEVEQRYAEWLAGKADWEPIELTYEETTALVQAGADYLKIARPDIDWDYVHASFDEIFPEGEGTEEQRSQRDSEPTELYLIVACDRPATKVGIASNAEQRRSHLQAGHPVELIIHTRLLFTERRHARTVEQWVLREFAEKRLVGEWIDMSADELRPMIERYIDRHLGRKHLAYK